MKHELNVQGMHCTSCAMNIDDELEELDGVNKAATSYAKQRTKVEIDENQIELHAVVTAIEQLGYTVAPKA